MLAWGAIAVAQISLIWTESFMNGYHAKILDAVTGPMLGHIQIHAPRYREDSALERSIHSEQATINAIRSEDNVRAVSPRIYAPVLVSLKDTGHVASVIGIDFIEEFGNAGLLGDFSHETAGGSDEVWLGKSLAEDMGVHTGDEIALMGQAADGSIASGLYRVTKIVQTAVEMVNREGVLMSLESAQDLFVLPDQVHELIVYSKTPDKIEQVLTRLKAIPELSETEILPWNSLVPQLANLLDLFNASNLIILILLFLTTIAGIANTMLMATFERSHEFGMLLALGCHPGRLVRLILVEALTLGFTGVLIGSVVGFLWVNHQAYTGIDLAAWVGAKGVSFGVEGANVSLLIFPDFGWSSVRDGVLAILATSIIASFWPARRIAKLQPAEAMRT